MQAGNALTLFYLVVFGGRRLGRSSPPLFYPIRTILFYLVDYSSPPLSYSIPLYLVGHSVDGVFGRGVAAVPLFYSTLFYSILFGEAFRSR